eukprot:1931854-Prymnesium_polylepis.1
MPAGCGHEGVPLDSTCSAACAGAFQLLLARQCHSPRLGSDNNRGVAEDRTEGHDVRGHAPAPWQGLLEQLVVLRVSSWSI